MAHNPGSGSASSSGPSLSMPAPAYAASTSRPSSLSSSSIITVKRSSSQGGSRDSIIQIRSHSPGDSALLAVRAIKAGASSSKSRRASITHDTPDIAERPANEASGNRNRWSQSTASSLSSAGGEAAKLRAASGNQQNNQLWAKRRPSASPTSTSRRRQESRDTESPRGSPQLTRPPSSSGKGDKYRPRGPPSGSSRKYTPTNPPVLTLPASTFSSQDIRSGSTLQSMSPSSTGLLTPASYTLNPDYFALDMSKVAYAKSPDVSPISPVGGHSKFSSRRIANEQRSQKHSDAPSENTRSPEDLAELARRKSRAREKREKDKKTMLSKALEKANTAVLLDNVQNFGGALDAYKDACHLLQLVMERTSAFEDRRKLEAIRETYTARIEELDQLQQPQTNESERPLPPRPMSNDSEVLEPAFGSHRTDDRVQEPGSPIEVAEIIPPTTATRNTGTDDTGRRTRDSFLTNAIREVEGSKQGGFLGPLWERSKSPMGLPLLREHDSRTPEQLKSPYAPPPLSPWRPVSPAPPPKDYPAKQQQTQGWQDKDLPPLSRDPDPVATSDSKPSEASKSAPPPPDSDPISWLDTIDESGSDRSSVHSGTPGHPRRKLLGRARGDSGADDFDAAFDAAVEAAYEDGYEPDTSSHFKNSGLHDPAYHRSSTDQGQSKPSTSSKSNAAASAPYLRDFDDDADERQLLDDIAREYMHHGFEFNLQSSSKPALPRESDSSGVSRSTWQSSTLSDKPTAGTSLSTLEEMDGVHRSSPAKDSQRVVSHSSTTRFGEEPAPGLLPTSTLQRPTSSQTGAEILARRSKRLSGPVLKPLKIETSARSLEPQQYNEPGSARSTRSGSSATRAAIAEEEGLQLNTARTASTDTSVSSTSKTSRVPSSGRKHTGGRTPVPASAISETDTSTSFNSSFAPQSADVFTELHSPRPRFLRKNKSSLSLRGYDVPTSSAESEMPMITPQTSTYSQAQSRSREGTFSQRAHASSSAGATDHAQVGGMYLFDTTITTAASRPTTSTSSADASLPPPLEPCPDSHLLRPFWLLRRVSQTVTHPRGGYITTRLFVPHEAWLNRTVKLKNIDDKISSMDLLTAGLGRLGNVDTYDADAVLVELQNYEEVMERVQATLVKRLGGEVGVQSVGALFKDAAPSFTTDGPSSDALGLSTTNSQSGAGGSGAGGRDSSSRTSSGKNYLSGWRKLRGKNSTGAANLSLANNGAGGGGAGANKGTIEGQHTMSSVPMTSFAGVEKRTNSSLQKASLDASNGPFEGPLASYMASLAKLCEAAQTLDQIARQVEDPGLRHSSSTHVGLELSIRHAAEFFGFYICRFVLADVGTLVDKFVKRSSEWVLA